MTAPLTLSQMLEASRLFEVREAVIATLKRLFPDVMVAPHPGKIDVSDIVEGQSFTAPSLLVAAQRLGADLGTSAGQRATPLDFVVYIVAEDRAVAGRLVTRDEIALALCEAVASLLNAPALEDTRWGVADIGAPEAVDAKPVFTSKAYGGGLIYWAVTWRQTIYADAPLWDMDGLVPSDAPPPPLLAPGDPDYPAGGAP